MSPKLDDLLCETFPKIFAERHLPLNETAMCWGFECDDGWFDLIYNLCKFLQHHTNINRFPQVVANQVKEKYGTLHFYYRLTFVVGDESFNSFGDFFLQGAIAFAECMSASICEVSGKGGKLYEKDGWLKTLCEEEATKLGYIQKE